MRAFANMVTTATKKATVDRRKKKKKKKKDYEEDPVSSDSSDLEYPEQREGHYKYIKKQKSERRKKLKEKRLREKLKNAIKANESKSKTESDDEYAPCISIDEDGSSSSTEEEISKLEDIIQKPVKKITPEYLEYKAVMDKVWKAKEEEEARKRMKKEMERKQFLPERYEKTGATPKMVHTLKFIAHGHNRHHALLNDTKPSAKRDTYLSAISIGKAQTVDAFLGRMVKEGDLKKKEEQISQLVEYARERVHRVIDQEMLYMPPIRPVYDDGTSDSVRTGLDIERFTLSKGGVARMDPMTDQLSRHVISPETSSKERVKRMGEGIMDAVDRDLQDLPKIKKIEVREQRAMRDLKTVIREYHGEGKIISSKDILYRNDLRDKIRPLLDVLYNNQHPGLRRNRDFFAEAVHQIIFEDSVSQLLQSRQEPIEQQHPLLPQKTKNKKSAKRRRKKGPIPVACPDPVDDTTSQKDFFGFIAYANTAPPEELKRDSYALELMKRVPIQYTEPTTGVEIIVGQRLVPMKEGERLENENDYPLDPVPIRNFPFNIKGDTKEQTRMIRSLRKMKNETLLPRKEYESVYEQEMAPKEPHIRGLYAASLKARGSGSTNRFGQRAIAVGYNAANKRTGTSLPKAKKRMRENNIQAVCSNGDIANGEEEEEEQPGYDRKEELTPEEILASIQKATEERLEDEKIMCPQLPNYREDRREDEEPSVTNRSIFDRSSCIMHLVTEQKERKKDFEERISAYSRGTNIENILQNPSLYEGIGGQGIAGLGEACSPEYRSAFLREPVGNERDCCNGKRCMGVMLPILKNWPDTTDVASADGGPILREFYRPEQFRSITQNLVYPEERNPCVLCIDYLTTQACYSFASNDTAPKCTIQYYHVTGYNKKVLIPMHSSRKQTSTGIIAACKMFRIQDYFLSNTVVNVSGKNVRVRCYEERMYTEDAVGGGGIAGATTLDGYAITNRDFCGASVVSVKES